MSVGLIHDLKMDNMKSLEQDKVEPHLKMNDEHKVKQEMYVLISVQQFSFLSQHFLTAKYAHRTSEIQQHAKIMQFKS